MENKISYSGIILSVLFVLYSLTSYLIFLRDDFLLERISVLTQRPIILEVGRKLAKDFHVNSLPTLIYLLIILMLFFIYSKALRSLYLSKSSNKIRTTILKYAFVFTLITFISFPSLSTDVFDYIASNRVLFVHHQNPWLHPPQDFPQDEFIYLGSWKFRASVYGPVQFIFSSLVQLISKNNLIANIIGFKLINILFLCFSLYVIDVYLERYFPQRKNYGLAIFAWNPLLYIEIIANAHNDIIMAFFSLLAFFWLFEGKTTRAGISLAVAILAKVVAVLYIPVLIICLLSENKVRQLQALLTAIASMTILGFACLGRGLFGFINNLGVQLSLYLRSLPTIVRFLFIQLGFSLNNSQIIEKLIIIPPFSWLYYQSIKKFKSNNLFETLVIVMMIYLMIASPMLQPWYLVWFLPFLPFIKTTRVLISALAFTLGSLLYYVVLFVSFYSSPLNFTWQIVMYLTTVLPPLVIWFIPNSWYTQMGRILFCEKIENQRK